MGRGHTLVFTCVTQPRLGASERLVQRCCTVTLKTVDLLRSKDLERPKTLENLDIRPGPLRSRGVDPGEPPLNGRSRDGRPRCG